MKTTPAFFFLFLFAGITCVGQALLPYSINKAGPAHDSAKNTFELAPESMTPGYFSSCGIAERDVSPDFILYDTAGTPCQLSTLLGEGKPVLLVAISLSCPQSRKSMDEPLSTIIKTFGNKINIRLIYVIDAHPISPEICPYSGDVYTTANNFRDSILVLQPKTYLERKLFAKRFMARENPGVPVLIDSPENSYWKTFGPAPNNAYLITPGGMIYKKYGWFENPKSTILSDISRMLSNPMLLKNDFSKDARIGNHASSGDTCLFVANKAFFEVSIYNSTGDGVYYNAEVSSGELNLEKIPILAGAYVIEINSSTGYSYCIRYLRK